MKTIWKYEVAPDVVNQVMMLPRGAEILSFGLDPADRLCFWALVDDEAFGAEHVISCVGTGWGMDRLDTAKFIGTVTHGMYVWHLFDLGEIEKGRHEGSNTYA